MASVRDVVKRIKQRDPSTDSIILHKGRVPPDEMNELADCLMAHPDVSKEVWLCNDWLPDEIGAKLGLYVSASSTVRSLGVNNTRLGETTYLALAAALRVNTSLRRLYLHTDQRLDMISIDAAFVDALRLNPVRPDRSEWHLHSPLSSFYWLNMSAQRLGAPSMLLYLDFAQQEK